MTNGSWVLVRTPLRSLRRSIAWWSIGLGSLIGATVAFWPAFRGTSGISEAIGRLPSGIIEAFGLQDFGTPAGFLRGNLYEFFVPLMLAIAVVASVTGQTAGDEAAGRLELFFAQPVDRGAIYLGRALASLLGLALIGMVLLLVQLIADAVFDLVIDAWYVASTLLLSTLLAAVFGALAYAIAGARARPSLVLAVGVGAAVAAYVVSALFPLSGALEPLSHLSPWDWAFGGDPLVRPTEPWRFAALAVPSVLLVATGSLLVRRRDAATA